MMDTTHPTTDDLQPTPADLAAAEALYQSVGSRNDYLAGVMAERKRAAASQTSARSPSSTGGGSRGSRHRPE